MTALTSDFLNDFPLPAAAQRLPVQPEAQALAQAHARLGDGPDWPAVIARARPWVQAVRDKPPAAWAMESLLKRYPISSAEGLALMRLAEALLRVPDRPTAVALTADQLGSAGFEDATDGLWSALSGRTLALAKKLLPGADEAGGLIQRLGVPTVVGAAVQAVELLGRQFVLGRSIEEALRRAADQVTSQAQIRLRFSYDMLGEAARTEADAQRHLAAYTHAIATIAARRKAPGGPPEQSDGLSIKLSALFPRYEHGQRERVFAQLLPRLWRLVRQAADANLGLTIDAEEADRLELQLEVFEALAQRVRREAVHWRGLGLAVQAYQTRALALVDELALMARKHELRLMVRLVKGAYWDGEIKRAQELGLASYPVYTQKAHTDVSYLACAQALLDHGRLLYPQFATHNAATIAAVQLMADRAGAQADQDYEMQRLHGMGDGIYREVLATGKTACRVYAPVGQHRELLAYLVRRLLENGANSSFVNQLLDVRVPIESVLRWPLQACGLGQPVDALPLPPALFGQGRRNSSGIDLSDLRQRQPLEEAVAHTEVAWVPGASPAEIERAMDTLQRGWRHWSERPLVERAAMIRKAGDLLDARLAEFGGLLVKQAHKTLGDCIAEVREAVDFCRYYADQAEQRLAEQTLPGPTGESNTLRLRGRGVFVCISPWNFPLAIFTGQVVAALVAGNTVAAKPAEQTPAVALRMVELLRQAGVPEDALILLHGPGETVGAALVAHPQTAGVCFTGSTEVARRINRALAAKDGPIVPLIAETGGLNAMLVDSTALPEQVVDAVVQSAFGSAGQRCSALRLLCVHEGIADTVIEMLRGAMAELSVGDPARLATDVGPVIDEEARARIQGHIDRLHRQARLLAQAPLGDSRVPGLIAPIAFELDRIDELREEIFGPVLHVVRWRGDPQALMQQIHALGYGLTLGIQTRIDSRAAQLARQARVGNVYINRSMTGAVVGVQPFGGEGLSGTGPKAGGPHYLYRFCSEQTVTINTAAAGGNAALLSQGH